MFNHCKETCGFCGIPSGFTLPGRELAKSQPMNDTGTLDNAMPSLLATLKEGDSRGDTGCSNDYPECVTWESYGYCAPTSQYYNMMFNHCKETCGFCGIPSGFTLPGRE